MLLRLNNLSFEFINKAEILEDALSHNFPEAFKKKFEKISNVSARELSISAYYLLSKLLEEYNANLDALNFTENGKPILNNGLYVSLSHSGEYVCAAVSKSPVGIDIEEIRDFDLKILDRFFTKKEKRYILKRNTNERFFTIWTFKEAIIKLQGKKLANIKEIKPLIFLNRIFYKNYKIISKTSENYRISIALNEKTGI